jgi:4-hydroxy-4-methyl-2-oxoglutarate aldolase
MPQGIPLSPTAVYTAGMGEQTNAQVGGTLRFEELAPGIIEALSAPIVSDSLDAVGIRNQVMSREVVPLVTGTRIAGRARTVQFVPTESDSADPYGTAMDFIDSLAAGSVAVIATGRDDRTAYWGELFSAAATGRGAVGAICDGPVRDTPKVRRLGFPLFASGTRPIDFRARMRITSVGEPVRCAGALVAQGDLVIADDDGVVVVPAAAESDVLRLAVVRATAERSVLSELLAGAGLREVWERWHVL